MKRILLASVLLATPIAAFAQQQQSYVPTAQTLLNQALQCETLASGKISQLQGQLEAMTKERDALKIKPADKPTEK